MGLTWRLASTSRYTGCRTLSGRKGQAACAAQGRATLRCMRVCCFIHCCHCCKTHTESQLLQCVPMAACMEGNTIGSERWVGGLCALECLQDRTHGHSMATRPQRHKAARLKNPLHSSPRQQLRDGRRHRYCAWQQQGAAQAPPTISHGLVQCGAGDPRRRVQPGLLLTPPDVWVSQGREFGSHRAEILGLTGQRNYIIALPTLPNSN